MSPDEYWEGARVEAEHEKKMELVLDMIGIQSLRAVCECVEGCVCGDHTETGEKRELTEQEEAFRVAFFKLYDQLWQAQRKVEELQNWGGE